MQNELTPEAAIVELNRCKVNGYTPTDWDRRCKAVEIGKQAINRCMIGRKPKATLVRGIMGGFEKKHACTCCNGVVIELTDYFCPSCGQKLDWTTE